MTVVVDASLVLALYDASDANHLPAAEWVRDVDDELVTSPLVVAELDQLVGAVAPKGRAALLDDLERGAITVRWWADALAESIAIARATPSLGLSHASLLALAARFRTPLIATFDLPRFRPLTTAAGEPYVLLPADAT